MGGGYNGASFNRPGFQEMMKPVEDYGVSILNVISLSGLGREYSYSKSGRFNPL